MKNFLLTSLAMIAGTVAYCQIGIGTPTPNSHAVLDLKSPGNNQGLMTPSVTNIQRNDATFIASLGKSETGLLIFDTDDKQFYYWTGTTWDQILNSSSAAKATQLVAAGGDLTGTYPAPLIGAGKVSSAAILDGGILNEDISGAAAIVDTKLGTITTPGKVSGNAIVSGTIGGATVINTTGTITTSSLTVTTALNPTTVTASNTAAGGTAITGKTTSASKGYGVFGQATGTTSGGTSTYSYGVYGKNTFNNSAGYLGGQYGVYGELPTGTAIMGTGKVGVSGNGGSGGYGTGVVGAASGLGSYGVYSNGAAGGTTTWSATSDRRFKKNIQTITDGLDKIMALRGVSYDWRTDEFPDRNFSTNHDVGVIAQEVKEVVPEVVLEDKNGYYSVSYEKIVPVLIEAIHQQQTMIEKLQQEMNALIAAKNNGNGGGQPNSASVAILK